MNNKSAFTLAEVLITLTIIGVIAALTIPNLMQKWQDHADVAKVKEAHSIIDNALKMTISEYGPLSDWAFPVKDGSGAGQWGATNSTFLGDRLKNYLKVQKYCGSEKDCFKDDKITYYGPSGKERSIYFGSVGGKMILENGWHIGFAIHQEAQLYNNGTPNNVMYVDFDGPNKGVNKIGYDVFEIPIYEKGVATNTNWGNVKSNGCNPNGTHSATQDGCTCFWWVLRHGNMDYKYRDVSKEW